MAKNTSKTRHKTTEEKLRKQSEDLKDNESHWKSITDHTPDIVARFDKNLHCSFANKSLQKITDSGRNYVSKHISEINFFKNQKLKELAAESMNDKSIKEYYFTPPYGNSAKHYYFMIIPEAADGGEVNNVLLIGRDVTAMKRYEEKIEGMNRELKKANAYLDNFVHTLAHDLQSPVSNLQLICNILEQIDNPDEFRLYKGKIKEIIHKLRETLSGLIEIIEVQNDVEAHAKKIDFQQIFDYAMKEYDGGANADITTDFNDAPQISYFEPYLKSILRNLISNSFKYRAHDRKLKLHVKSYRKDNRVVLEFSDNGIGIDLEKYKNQLFKPFQRINKKLAGKGIGLYIMKSMVERNGGGVDIRSRYNEGTTFIFYFKEY